MFSILFPGQGSQNIGMAKELFQNFNYVKDYFLEADEILNKKLSNIIFDGPKNLLDQTQNTQPAIFLTSYSIFYIAKNEFGINFENAEYIAGHSLGEYSALCCFGALSFEDTLKILKKRGKSMQEAVPANEGSMLAVLGSDLKVIEDIIKSNSLDCFIANNNSPQQVVISGLKKNVDLFSEVLNKHKIKNIRLNVSAPFHCKLMKKATENLKDEILNLNFKEIKNPIISNFTANSSTSSLEIKNLLVSQIEGRVKWVESVKFMIDKGTKNFIEIGPGKVLSGLTKRIDKNININSINNERDIKKLIKNV